MSRAMSPYRYSALLPGPDRIRLLRIMPHKDPTAPIQCHLLDYSLQESSKWTHLYEAVSYVWGGSDKPSSIFIGEHPFNVTINLHAALSHLRDRSIERIIWVDAICINQKDLQERSHQVQLMAKIYSKANRVIVWLGETTDDSDRALEEIRIAAGTGSINSSSNKATQQAILTLLQRQWFRRIWVLQEVAVARHVLIMCGSTEIDGYAFCLGLELLEGLYEAWPELQSRVRSVTYLIRGAIFRPKYATRSLDRTSLDIRPLGELIDMFHTHEATERHDKVYALLGISSDLSSDNLKAAGLLPDYTIPWKQLFQRLVEFLLCKQLFVETWNDRERAVIKSKGCVLGQVSSIVRRSKWGSTQTVDITSKTTTRRERHARLTLQTSAKSIQQGDLVCLLQGAPKPTIIRPCTDHFAIIMVTATPPEYIQMESGDVEWPKLLQSITVFPCDFLLVWDWEKSLENLQEWGVYETLMETNRRALEHSNTKLQDNLDKLTRLWNMALILVDSEQYAQAKVRLLETTEGYKRVLGKEHPLTLASMDKLALIYKKNKQLTKAEELFVQVIQTRRRVQGVDHSDTLNSMANLASTYTDQRRLKEARRLEVITHLLKQKRDVVQIIEEVAQIAEPDDKELITFLLDLRGDVQITKDAVKAAAGNPLGGKEVMSLLLKQRDNFHITQDVVVQVAGAFDAEVMTLLLERGLGDVQITEEVVKAAAGNLWNGREVMTLLLEQRGDDVQITEGVVKAAAGNDQSGEEVITLLLEERGDNIQITEEFMVQIAGSFNKAVITLLLKQRGDDVQITDEVVKAAARNERSGKEIMTLLLERRVPDVQITEDIVKAAAENPWSGKEVMTLLLEKSMDDAQITEAVVTQIARSFGKEVMSLLLKQRDNVRITQDVVVRVAGSFDAEAMTLLLERGLGDVQITEEVVKAAAGNWRSGKAVIMLLLERTRDDVQITEGVVKAAAGNPWNGKGVMMLLLKRRGDDVQITEGVVVQIAESFDKAVMALLLEQRGDDVQVTEEVVKAAARNERSGKEIMTLLLERRASDVQITEEIVKAAAGNENSGKEVIILLLERKRDDVHITEGVVVQIVRLFDRAVVILLLSLRGDDVQITEEIVKAAAENPWSGKEVMLLLLEQRGDDIQITEGVVKAAAGNPCSGKEVMLLLLEQRGDDVQITEGVVKAAAGNPWSGKEVMLLLLEQRGDALQITEGVVKAAAENPWNGKEVMLLLEQRERRLDYRNGDGLDDGSV